MTSLEIIYAILQDRLLDREPTEEEVGRAEVMRRELENPWVYWEDVIERLEDTLAAARQKLAAGAPPPWAERIKGLKYGPGLPQFGPRLQ